MRSTRDDLLDILKAALTAVNGRRCVSRCLQTIELEPRTYHVVAIGKAAEAMYRGALDVLGPRLGDALVVTKSGHASWLMSRAVSEVTVLEAGHPVPDVRSLAAGARLLEFLAAVPPDDAVMFLVSGGASSLVEVPAAGVTLDELVRLNRWLLSSGLPIQDVNTVRRAVSAIKGGRLIAHLAGRSAIQLVISDVPGDDPTVIASGLLNPTGPKGDLRTIFTLLPPWAVRLLEHQPKPADSLPSAVATHIVATVYAAMQAAASAARGLGYRPEVHGPLLIGDAVKVGARLARLTARHDPALHIWGGETTVRLPPSPGRGGRSQLLALSAAVECAGREDVVLLAAATDGTDGPTGDAGAMVDGATVARCFGSGLDPRKCIAHADAGRCLAASGDLLCTGPTGTNVMDLVFGLRLPGG